LAIDHGANPGAVVTDQRGNVRQNGLFDIGAVEQTS